MNWLNGNEIRPPESGRERRGAVPGKKRERIIGAVSLLFVGLFLYTGIKKLFDIEYTAYTIRNYPVYKYVLGALVSSYLIAYIVPVLELSAVCLFLVTGLRKALLFVFGLLVFYTLNILSLIIENSYFDCGCGLFYLSSNPSLMLATDLLLVTLAAYLLMQTRPGREGRTLWQWLFNR